MTSTNRVVGILGAWLCNDNNVNSIIVQTVLIKFMNVHACHTRNYITIIAYDTDILFRLPCNCDDDMNSTENAYSSGHLVPSFLGLAYVLPILFPSLSLLFWTMLFEHIPRYFLNFASSWLFRLIRSVLRASNFSVLKMIEIVILWV